jgi:hypothetical protein
MTASDNKYKIVEDVFNDCEVCTDCQYFVHYRGTPYEDITCSILDGPVNDPEFCPGYEQYKNFTLGWWAESE